MVAVGVRFVRECVFLTPLDLIETLNQLTTLAHQKFKDIRDTLIQMDREQPIMVLGGGMARFISYFAVSSLSFLVSFTIRLACFARHPFSTLGWCSFFVSCT